MLLHSESFALILVLPYMASLVAKKKGNKLYYYVVESARVDGKPRIVLSAAAKMGTSLAVEMEPVVRLRSGLG
jgi:hypothetical protein